MIIKSDAVLSKTNLSLGLCENEYQNETSRHTQKHTMYFKINKTENVR